MIILKPDIKREVLALLRDPATRQTTGALSRMDLDTGARSYSAEGVFGELLVRRGLARWMPTFDAGGRVWLVFGGGDNWGSIMFPNDLLHHLAQGEDDTMIFPPASLETFLLAMNDWGGFSLPELADLIETHW